MRFWWGLWIFSPFIQTKFIWLIWILEIDDLRFVFYTLGKWRGIKTDKIYGHYQGQFMPWVKCIIHVMSGVITIPNSDLYQNTIRDMSSEYLNPQISKLQALGNLNFCYLKVRHLNFSLSSELFDISTKKNLLNCHSFEKIKHQKFPKLSLSFHKFSNSFHLYFSHSFF